MYMATNLIGFVDADNFLPISAIVTQNSNFATCFYVVGMKFGVDIEG